MKKLLSIYLVFGILCIGTVKTAVGGSVTPTPASSEEITWLAGQEANTAVEVEEIDARGDDFLAIIGGVFLVIAIIAAVAKNNSKSGSD